MLFILGSFAEGDTGIARPLLTNRLTNSMGLDGARSTIRHEMVYGVWSGWYSL